MRHLNPDTLQRLRHLLAGHPHRPRLLRAMEQGTYGLCAQCGDTLDATLLLEHPDRGLCPECTQDLLDDRRARRHGVCGIKPR